MNDENKCGELVFVGMTRFVSQLTFVPWNLHMESHTAQNTIHKTVIAQLDYRFLHC